MAATEYSVLVVEPRVMIKGQGQPIQLNGSEMSDGYSTCTGISICLLHIFKDKVSGTRTTYTQLMQLPFYESIK